MTKTCSTPEDADPLAWSSTSEGSWPGRVFLAGLAVLVLHVTFLTVVYLVDPHHGTQLLEIQTVYLVGGRESAALAGLTPPPAPHALLIFGATAGQNVSVMLLGLPVVVYAMQRCRHHRFFAGILDRLERTVDRHRDRIQRGGPPALAAFSFLPFMGTGPIVAAILGVAARLRPRTVLAASLGGALTADLLWSLFSVTLAQLLSPFQQVLRLAPLAALAIVLTLLAMKRWRWRRGHDHYAFASQLPGVSSSEARTLRAEGILYVDDLLDVDPEALAERSGIDADRVRAWQSTAERSHEADLSPGDVELPSDASNP